ncbi:MAG: TonB-dependent receptor [Alphaproteobacteria bacterium]|nr:TonB-dependent receptor [Alphaproteobacteria bacterium]
MGRANAAATSRRDTNVVNVFRATLLGCAAFSVMSTGAVAQDTTDGDETILMAPISVTATEVAPGGVTITEEELERRNPQSIKDVFRGESAIQVGGGSDVSRKIYINGVEDTNLNVKMDDSRQVNSAFHHLGTAIIDPGLLKSVSVETGVGPVDVGPGALGGSIAYETKDARDMLEIDEMLGGFSRSQVGSNGRTYSQALAFAGQHENFEAMVYGSVDGGRNYEDGRDDEVIGTRPNMRNSIGKAAWTGNTGGRLEFNTGYMEDKGIRPNRANFGSLNNGAEPTLQEYNRKHFTLSYRDEAPTETFNPEVVLSYTETELFIHDLAFGPFRFDLRSQTKSYSGKVANTFSTGLGLAESGSVTVGTDFYRDVGHGDISGGFSAATVPRVNTETSDNVGLFAQARLNVTPAFRANLGLRYDQQQFEGVDGTRLDGGGPSASLNLEYDVLPWLTGYGGAASNYGPIPLGESQIYNFAAQWVYDGLTSSRSYNYKAGVKVEDGGVSGDFHVYQTEIDGSHNLGSATRNSTRDLTARGFNVSGQYQEDIGYVRATYSNNRFRSDGLPLSSGDASYHGLQMGNTATLDIVREWIDIGLAVGASAEYAFEDDTNETFPNKSYFVTDVFAQYQPTEMEAVTLRLDVRNLFDELYVDRATSATDNSAATPFNEPGRSFLVSAKVDF